MKNVLLSYLALACSLACSGPMPGDEDDLGQAEETYLSGTRGGTAQFGTRTASSNLMCDSVTTGQVCLVPKTKSIMVFFTGPTGSGAPSAADIQAVRVKLGGGSNGWFGQMVAQGLDVSAEPWSYTETTDVNNPLLSLVVSVNMALGACGSGGTANKVEKYSCFTGTTTGLTEDSGVVGQYVKFANVPVLNIDLGAVRARGANATEDDNLLRKVVWNGMNRMQGIGQLDTANARCSARTIDAFALSNPCILQTTEACILSKFGEMGDATHFGIVTGASANCGT